MSSVLVPQQNYLFVFVPRVDEKGREQGTLQSFFFKAVTFLSFIKAGAICVHMALLHSYMTDQAMLSGLARHGKMRPDSYLIRVVLQRAVVAMVSHPVPVSIPLVHVVNIWAVVVLVQNT